MLIKLIFFLLLVACFGCELKLNEIVSNMYRFNIDQDADFIELLAVDCKFSPDLSSIILLLIQLDYKGDDTPVLLQFASLKGQRMQYGKFQTTFSKYFSIGNRIPDINSFVFSQTEANHLYNWVTIDDYYGTDAYSRTFGTTETSNPVHLSKNFAVILMNTTKSNRDNIDSYVEKLQFVFPDDRGNDKSMIYLNDEGLCQFIYDTTMDCMVFVAEPDKLSDNNMGKQLSALTNKPLLNYDIRGSKGKSINVCGDQLVEASITPNGANNCEGNVIYTQNKCVFKKPSKTEMETQSRPDFAKTSAKCSIDIKSFKQLSNEKETRYGTVNLADYILAKGEGKFIDFENGDAVTALSDSFACEHHIKELTDNWLTEKNLQVRGTINCVLGPYFDSNKHERKVKSDRFINRDESFRMLKKKGFFIPIGTPSCSRHEKLIAGLEEDTLFAGEALVTTTSSTTTTTSTLPLEPRARPQSYCNMDSNIDTLTLRYTKKDQCLSEDQQKSLKSTLQAIPFSPMEMEKPFDEMDPSNQRRHVKMFTGVCSAVAALKTKSKKSQNLLIKKACERMDVPSLGQQHSGDKEENMKVLVKYYFKADNKKESYQYLSILTTILPYHMLQHYIPNLSSYEYTEAKKIGLKKLAGQTPLEIHRKSYLRQSSLAAIEDYVSFLASSLMTTVLPYGENSVKLSDGTKLDLPNAFCDFGPIDTITFYRAEKTRRGELVELSDSTMYRIYKTCVTKKRVALQGVDTFKAAGVGAFQKISKVVLNDLKQFGLIMPEEHDDFEKMMLESEFFLKTDFYSKLQMEHKSPYLCMRFALSDPGDRAFQTTTCTATEDHNIGCKECDSYRIIITQLQGIITTGEEKNLGIAAQNALLFHTETLKEAIYKIDDWRSHIVRGRFAQDMKADIVENLEDGSCLLTADYSQKWLPRAANEDSSSYYSKAGLSLHVIHCLCNITGILMQHSYGHIMGYADQNADIVSGILVNTLKKLKQKQIKSCILKTDNAGYYKSAVLIQIIPSVSRKSGILIKRYTYSEAQLGKDVADVDTSRIKGVFLACLNNQKNVNSASDMYDCLKTALERSKLIGFTVVHVKHIGNRPSHSDVPKITGVTNVGDIEYTLTDEDATLRYWRHFRIGSGKVKNVAKDKATVVEFKEEESCSSAGFNFWRRKIDPTDSTEQNSNEQSTRSQNSASGHAENGSNLQNQNENTTPQVPNLQPEEFETDRGTFPCPVDGCVKDFIRYANLEKHLLVGRHTFAPRRETLQDIAVQMYLAELEGVREGFSFFRNHLFDSEYARETLNINAPSQGWALKKRAPRASYTAEMIAFLENKYIIARQRGQKRLDAIVTSEEMSTAAHPTTGRPLFTAEQRLSASQIASFINQKLKKLEKRVGEFTSEEERNENNLIFDEMVENPGHVEDEATDHPHFADLTEDLMDEIVRERNQELFM